MPTPPAEAPPGPAARPPADTALAGGTAGPEALRRMTATVLEALAQGAGARGGPLPPGGPAAVAQRTRARCAPLLPEEGVGAEAALRDLVHAVAEGAADPADPACAAHLHCPPLAAAVAADLAASALNPSMDSWDQAPAAGVVEEDTTAALAALAYPGHPCPDAVITSGGTESNLVALLLARERARAAGAPTVQVVQGGNAHHSVRRAAWILGLPAPVTVPCRDGVIDPSALARTLAAVPGPALVVATAGTTDEGLIDPLPEIAAVAASHGAELHVDAAYGGPLLFSDRLRDRLDGIGNAVSITLDLHKLGWQPVAAGVLAVGDATTLGPLSVTTGYLNADDDTEAGLPDLLGRSLRTSRRPDALKIAVTMRALGRRGMGRLVEDCVRAAESFATALDADPALRRRPGPVGISTVLFRPAAADELPGADGDALVAEVRRALLVSGRAVLGRACATDAGGRDRLWLKATLLHPHATEADLAALRALVTSTAARLSGARGGPEDIPDAPGVPGRYTGPAVAEPYASRDPRGPAGTGRAPRPDRPPPPAPTGLRDPRPGTGTGTVPTGRTAPDAPDAPAAPAGAGRSGTPAAPAAPDGPGGPTGHPGATEEGPR